MTPTMTPLLAPATPFAAVPPAVDSRAAPRPGARPETPAGATGYERLVIARDPEVGLLAVICVDSTVLGPADGGVRMRPYPDLAAAVADATALASAMTRKWSLAGAPRGGGKAVIVGDATVAKTPELLRAFGRVVDSLQGTYWAGADAGTTVDDLAVVHTATPYVTTLPKALGGIGDIGPYTAAGVLHAMRAACRRVWGTADLCGRTVALQGLGSCGAAALDLLVADGARVTVADVDPHRVERAKARHGRSIRSVPAEEIAHTAAEVFAPFAFGGAIDLAVARSMEARVVAGSANNLMASTAAEAELVDRGVVYAVDVVANAGGAIADADRFEPGGFDPHRVGVALEAIGPRLGAVLDRARERGILPSEAAAELADQRLRRARAARGRASSR